MKKRYFFVFLLLVGSVTAAPRIGFRIEDRNRDQKPLTVLVVGESIQDLDTYELSVSFDTTALSFRNAAIDAPASGIVNILKTANRTVIPMTKSAEGSVTIAATLSGSEKTSTRDGILGVLLFEVKRDTRTPIRLEKVSLLKSDGTSMEDIITHDLVIGGEK